MTRVPPGGRPLERDETERGDVRDQELPSRGVREPAQALEGQLDLAHAARQPRVHPAPVHSREEPDRRNAQRDVERRDIRRGVGRIRVENSGGVGQVLNVVVLRDEPLRVGGPKERDRVRG
jgi:hypothetical protein